MVKFEIVTPMSDLVNEPGGIAHICIQGIVSTFAIILKYDQYNISTALQKLLKRT